MSILLERPTHVSALERLCDDDRRCIDYPGTWIEEMRGLINDARKAGVPWEALKSFDECVEMCGREQGLCPECGHEATEHGPSWERMYRVCGDAGCGWRSE